MDEVREFYDDLSSEYHLIYGDWWRAVERQGQALDRVIETLLGPGPWRILDCTAGVGTQALGLAALGHSLVGTDISGTAIARAKGEAEARGLDAEFQTWDVRSIADFPGGPFDVVLSADNSLAHLLDQADLALAVEGMWSQVKEPGVVLISLRDYAELLEARPRFQGPRILGEPGKRRVILQLWDWVPGEPIYRLEHLILQESSGEWHASSRSCRYRALLRTELESCFAPMGPSRIEWLESKDSGFFQPLLCVSKRS